MQTEEVLLKLMFQNQMVFCGIFGALGGVVHTLDLRIEINLSALVSKIIISSSAGLLLFFATYDFSALTPAWRLAAAIVSGFYGSALFRYLARVSMRNFPGVPPPSEEELKDIYGNLENQSTKPSATKEVHDNDTRGDASETR